MSRARGELQQYKPAETGIDAWDADDRTMFQTAYRLHAKSFPKIKGKFELHFTVKTGN